VEEGRENLPLIEVGLLDSSAPRLQGRRRRLSRITEISRRLQVHDVDLPTVAAMGIVAFTLTAFLHEASHGAASC
jgi:hypothetical protein